MSNKTKITNLNFFIKIIFYIRIIIDIKTEVQPNSTTLFSIMFKELINREITGCS